MSYKQFSERLNKELDHLGVPSLTSERVEVLSKLIKVRKFNAQELLSGVRLPDQELMIIIAKELGVDPEWLSGKKN